MDTEQLLTPLTVEELDLPDNIVAAAVYVEGGEPSHAALIIKHDNHTRILHFFGNVALEMAEDAVGEGRYIFVKELDFIPHFLVPSFVAHCELIQKEARPTYGFFYDSSSFYGIDGKFCSPGDFPEYMTCVGFCLTVIQSYLINEEFLQYTDWDQRSYDLNEMKMAREMLQLQRDFPHLTPEDIQSKVRRIRPIEYFSGAYGMTRPVPKSFTDETSKRLMSEISLYIA